MRALAIEFLPKATELALLRGEIGRWRAGRFGFECAVHSFMPSVLLGLAGLDQIGKDAQPDPPGR